jgi:hypothetical protein
LSCRPIGNGCQLNFVFYCFQNHESH